MLVTNVTNARQRAQMANIRKKTERKRHKHTHKHTYPPTHTRNTQTCVAITYTFANPNRLKVVRVRLWAGGNIAAYNNMLENATALLRVLCYWGVTVLRMELTSVEIGSGSLMAQQTLFTNSFELNGFRNPSVCSICGQWFGVGWNGGLLKNNWDSNIVFVFLYG